MGQALYRHYRPKRFDEVIGQQSITETLQNALKTGRISHAYLLAGPKGVGKTSVARILAHEVNNLPYTDESIHLDIIEIDAASNRRIDEIRDIRQKVHIAPTSAKYKVYIIDEVHMLTKEAFNALLKTLEEPPAHVIFILATTEPHKLPGTIISRTQRFNFKPIADDSAVAQLKKIAKKEKISIESAALELLAQHSGGSFRDSLGMLDQLSGIGKEITEQAVRELLGLPPTDSISQLTSNISAGNVSAVLRLLTELKDAGNSPVLIASQLGRKLRAEITAGSAGRYNWSASLLKNLLEVSGANQPYELLEVILLQAAMENSLSTLAVSPELQTIPASPPPDLVEKLSLVKSPEAMNPKNDTKNSIFDLDLWPEVQAEIKKRAASIYTALRLAEPEVQGSVLTLTFQFPLHKNKVEQARHIKLISDVIQELSGAQIEIKCVLAEKPNVNASRRDAKTPKTAATSSELATISNIFGSAEMLE